MKTIGMDIGTTTVCAILADAETGKLLNVQTLTNDAHLKSEKSWERIQNPKRILELCRKLLAGYLDKYDDVESIGVTGAMHGILYTDKEGQAVSPLYTWQDQRGDQINPESGKSYAKELSEITGYAMATGFGLTTHYFVQFRTMSLFRSHRRENHYFIKAWLQVLGFMIYKRDVLIQKLSKEQEWI